MEALMTRSPSARGTDPYGATVLRPDADYTIRPGGLSVTKEMIVPCGLRPGSTVLDIGCGAGSTVAYLRSRYALDACGIDSSARLIAFGSSLNPSLPIVEGDARALPFISGYFDCVVAECSLSVMGTDRGVLDEILRVLKDGGALLVSDVYARAPEKMPYPAASLGTGCLSHMRSRDGWIDAFRSGGFSVEDWTDRSQLLPSYIARTMMGDSRDPFWCGPGCDPIALKAARPGYFSLRARKERLL